ncbi:MAG: hypothetical protein KME38_23980 [Spirirestis rafaelensis WJT71-NPBG6]|nr:hypothetical protein [Spirirestis rafaelensis WJT71-NPBG6]
MPPHAGDGLTCLNCTRKPATHTGSAIACTPNWKNRSNALPVTVLPNCTVEKGDSYRQVTVTIKRGAIAAIIVLATR